MWRCERRPRLACRCEDGISLCVGPVPLGEEKYDAAVPFAERRCADGSLHTSRSDGIGAHFDGTTIWVANALRGECVRVAEGGKILDRARTTQPALSCVVGGDDGRTLYAATVAMLDPEQARAARRGRIETVRLGA